MPTSIPKGKFTAIIEKDDGYVIFHHVTFLLYIFVKNTSSDHEYRSCFRTSVVLWPMCIFNRHFPLGDIKSFSLKVTEFWYILRLRE